MLAHEFQASRDELFGRAGEFEVKRAAGIGDVAAAQEGTAQIGARAASIPHEFGANTPLEAFLAQDAHVMQCVREPNLRWHGDEVVMRLVQDAATHGEVRGQLVDAVEQAYGGAGNARRLGRELEARAFAADGERALDANERRELGAVAPGACRLDA